MEKKNEIDVTLQLQQEQALNEILKDSVKQQGETIRGMKHIIIGLIIGWAVTLCVGYGGFLWYESQFDKQVETEETTEVELDASGDSANAEYNDVDGNQYNDSATHNEGNE